MILIFRYFLFLPAGLLVSLHRLTDFSMLERFYRELLNFLTRQLNDRDAAADLAQESYARVLAAQHAGQQVLDGRALLYRVAKNLVTDQHRRSEFRSHESLDTVSESEEQQAPAYLQPEEALSSQQTVHAYSDAIEALPPRCREAFVLHIIEGLPQAEIAKHMGISISMVEKHVIRGTLACRLCERELNGTNVATSKRGR